MVNINFNVDNDDKHYRIPPFKHGELALLSAKKSVPFLARKVITNIISLSTLNQTEALLY